MEWFFDGLGTAIISLVLGGIGGGIIGYRIGVKQNIKQSQKAGDNSNQTQVGGIYHGRECTKGRK